MIGGPTPDATTSSKGKVQLAGDLGGVADAPKIHFVVGTSLPGSPTDGDICIVNVDTTNGVKWMFQYRSASASSYKWEFIGGAPLYAHVTTDETFTANGSFNDATTVGPTVTAPLAGDYTYWARSTNYTTSVDAAGGPTHGSGLSINSATPATQDRAASVTNVGAQVANEQFTLAFSDVVNVTTAGHTMKLRYSCNEATAHVLKRSLLVQPVRVG